MTDYDNTNRGVLFKNHKRREGKNDPQMRGNINVEGKEYWLSGWSVNAKGEPYTDKNGDRFISVAVQAKEERIDPQAPLTGATEPEDEIPF